jgi:hypothetical protein
MVVFLYFQGVLQPRIQAMFDFFINSLARRAGIDFAGALT